MDETNRFLMFILLVGLVYALYTYQQRYNLKNIEKPKKSLKQKKKKKKVTHESKITPDIISQFSLGSLNDVDLDDSVINTESLGSESLNFMDDKTTASSIFAEE